MSKTGAFVAFLIFFFALGAWLFFRASHSGAQVAAQGATQGQLFNGLLARNARIGPAPPGAKVAAGFLELANTGKTPARLVSVFAAFADKTELHQTTIENGIAKMRPLANGIALPPGQTVTLTHGGLHVMFLDISPPPPTATVVFYFSARPPATVLMRAGGGGGHNGH